MKKLWVLILLILIGALCFMGCHSSRETTGETAQLGEEEIIYIIDSNHQDTSFTSHDIKKALAAKEMLSIKELLNTPDKTPALIYTNEGDIIEKSTEGYLGLEKGKIYFTDSDRKGKKIFEITGILVSPPQVKITQTADLAFEYLKSGQPVMILYLDGLGYEKFLQAREKGLVPHVEIFQDVQKGVTVFPPISPVAYAAMVTGKNPRETGVKQRGNGIVECPSIFDFAHKMGKKTLIVEGNQQMISLSGKIELNTDENNDGSVDDEICLSAREKLSQDKYDLVLVHFHSIDDVSHQYGPEAPETREQIKVVDDYVGQLLDHWSGKVIIVSDHGQHGVDSAGQRTGSHGEFRASDLFIPFITGEVK